MRRDPIILGLITALAIGLVALPALAATVNIDIQGGSYHPASLTVESNTTVTWTNHDRIGHTVTSTDGLFDSGPIEHNETFNYTFTDTGTYPYGCTLNASTRRTPMQGVVIVVPEGMAVAPDGNRTSGEEPGNATLADLVSGSDLLTTFGEAVGKAGIAQTVLAASGPYTVFAPDDAAFEALGNETVAALFNDTETLDTLLMHHVVRGAYTVKDLAAEASAAGNQTVLTTLTGDNLTINTTDGNLTVGNATIVASDMAASNGVMQIIDTVLVPPGLVLPKNQTPVENQTPAENQTPVENRTPVAPPPGRVIP
ncbi:Fasciclin domain protein [anaerobic digester metagenome]